MSHSVHVRSCVLVCAPMCACVRMCACVWVCVCMNNEIAPFLGFLLSNYVYMTYILAHSVLFLSCGIMFLFLCVGDVAAGEASHHSI